MSFVVPDITEIEKTVLDCKLNTDNPELAAVEKEMRRSEGLRVLVKGLTRDLPPALKKRGITESSEQQESMLAMMLMMGVYIGLKLRDAK
jgi:hypothetical protein